MEICELCGERPAVEMDHDHKSDRIRGWVCRRCNFRLIALDDKEWLDKAQLYLDNPPRNGSYKAYINKPRRQESKEYYRKNIERLRIKQRAWYAKRKAEGWIWNNKEHRLVPPQLVGVS